MRKRRNPILLAGLLILGLIAPVAATVQIKQIIKVLGVGAAVKQFGPEINRAINGLSGHKDTSTKATRVVPIIVIGIAGKNSAIGAAQIMGTKAQIDKVSAVASPETGLFGNEIRIRALIPVSGIGDGKNLQAVDGVGVSGIVDLKL